MNCLYFCPCLVYISSRWTIHSAFPLKLYCEFRKSVKTYIYLSVYRNHGSFFLINTHYVFCEIQNKYSYESRLFWWVLSRCVYNKRQKGTVLNYAQQRYMFRSTRPWFKNSLNGLKKKCREMTRARNFYDYRNIGI